MSTQRYISTSFWEDEWVGELSWEEKYLYLYLLTNPRTTITGIYKAPLRMMAFETGLSRDRVEQLLETFATDGKAFYFKEHVIIPAWPRHQNWKKRERIKKGIQQQLVGVPPEILSFAYEQGYDFPKEMLKTPIQSYYLDSDSDLDLDSEEEEEKREDAPKKPATKATGTYRSEDGTELPVNLTRYHRLREEYGEKTVNSYLEKAYRYSLKVKGDASKYRDYTAAAEDYMQRDGVEKRPAETKWAVDAGELSGVSYD